MSTVPTTLLWIDEDNCVSELNAQSNGATTFNMYYWWGGFCSTCHHSESESISLLEQEASLASMEQIGREGRRCQRALNVAPNEPCREIECIDLGRHLKSGLTYF